MPELGKIVLLGVVNLVPSTIIPAITAYTRLLTEAEAILLGVLIMILLTAAEALYQITAVREQEKRELVVWNTQDAFDVRLSNIRQGYRRILSNRRDMPDLFQSFFEERVEELEGLIVEAANRDELHLERSHVVSMNVLLGSFRGESSDTFRAVHIFIDNNFFFDIYAKQYFYRVHQLVQEKRIGEVKRLMVYTRDEELDDARSIGLMKFHVATPKYSFRVIRMQDFRSLLRDYRLDVARDFGIYGDKYVYCAVENVIDNIVGYWIRSPNAVQSFIRFYEDCWDSPVAFIP